MKKVLILQNIIPHYRKPFYNFLASEYDVTVLHSGKPAVEGQDRFSEIIAPTWHISRLVIQGKVLSEVRGGRYDTVIAMFDVNWVMNVIAYLTRSRWTRFVWWGIGAGNSNWANTLKRYLVGRDTRLVLYNESGRKRMLELGVPADRLHVGNNTFHVPDRVPCHLNSQKDTILFVGTLMQRKQCDLLIEAFASVLDLISPSIRLTLIGGGAEEGELRSLVSQYKLDSRVDFKGPIDDPSVLVAYYRRSLVSVSIGQAGLSVLQSLAYGVPFMTKRNAISGGEIHNIIDGVNGVFCDGDVTSVANHIQRFCQDQAWARLLGENAFRHYTEHCTIEVMAQGFKDAIDVAGSGD